MLPERGYCFHTRDVLGASTGTFHVSKSTWFSFQFLPLDGGGEEMDVWLKWPNSCYKFYCFCVLLIVDEIVLKKLCLVIYVHHQHLEDHQHLEVASTATPGRSDSLRPSPHFSFKIPFLLGWMLRKSYSISVKLPVAHLTLCSFWMSCSYRLTSFHLLSWILENVNQTGH